MLSPAHFRSSHSSNRRQSSERHDGCNPQSSDLDCCWLADVLSLVSLCQRLTQLALVCCDITLCSHLDSGPCWLMGRCAGFCVCDVVNPCRPVCVPGGLWTQETIARLFSNVAQCFYFGSLAAVCAASCSDSIKSVFERLLGVNINSLS